MWWWEVQTGSWVTLWETPFGLLPSVTIFTSHSWDTMVSDVVMTVYFYHPQADRCLIVSPCFFSTSVLKEHCGASVSLRFARTPVCSLHFTRLELH